MHQEYRSSPAGSRSRRSPTDGPDATGRRTRRSRPPPNTSRTSPPSPPPRLGPPAAALASARFSAAFSIRRHNSRWPVTSNITITDPRRWRSIPTYDPRVSLLARWVGFSNLEPYPKQRTKPEAGRLRLRATPHWIISTDAAVRQPSPELTASPGAGLTPRSSGGATDTVAWSPGNAAPTAGSGG